MKIINKDTTITYLGHATVLIKSPCGKNILIDPWLNTSPVCPADFYVENLIDIVDIVLITHIHNDHVGDLIPLLKGSAKAVAICVPEVHAWLATKGVTRVVEMNMGGAVVPDGTSIKVSMTQAFHTSSFTNDDGTVIHGGLPVGYVLEFENGFTIYASGDTALFGDMDLIGEYYQPDLAILPIGDHYTMGPRAAARAALMLAVDYVVPIHYGTFPILAGTPEMLEDELGEDSEVHVLAIRPGQSVE